MTRRQKLDKRNKVKLIALAEQASAYVDLGFSLHQKTEYEAAIRCYTRGLELDKENDRIHCLLGLTYHNLGIHSLAIKHYIKSLQVNKQNEEAHYYAGFIYIQEKRLDEAIHHLKEALELNGKMTMACHYLAVALTLNGKVEEAIDLLEKRLCNFHDPPEAEVVFTLGDLLSGRREKKQDRNHAQAYADKLLNVLGRRELHVFGDSHRAVFNDLDQVTCHNIGAGTAYNLISTNSSTGAGNKILKKAKTLHPSNDALLLVFGEIDCMEHVFKNSYRHARDPEDIIDELVGRYIEFSRILRDQGFSVLIYGPSFSGVAFNSYGSLPARNWLIRCFNVKMRNATRREYGTFFTSLDHLVINKDLEPTLSLSADGRHLDNFPKASTIMQGAVLSGLILEIEQEDSMNMKKRLTIGQNEVLAARKPYIIIEKNRGSGKYGVKNGRDAMTAEESFGYSRGNEVDIIIDLLDHQVVDKMSLMLEPIGIKQEVIAEIRLTTFGHKGITGESGQLVFTLVGTRISIDLEPTIARAVWLQIKLSDILKVSGEGHIKVKDIRLRGQNHIIKES